MIALQELRTLNDLVNVTLVCHDHKSAIAVYSIWKTVDCSEVKLACYEELRFSDLDNLVDVTLVCNNHWYAIVVDSNHVILVFVDHNNYNMVFSWFQCCISLIASGTQHGPMKESGQMKSLKNWRRKNYKLN